MRTIPEVVDGIKSILNNIERTENCDGETLVDINELVDEILIISTYKPNKQTNADRIRSMNDEELAEFLEKIVSGNRDEIGINCGNSKCEEWKCTECIGKWLQSEVEE